MKKYPFSKKAVKAILAASIALSPFAATGVVAPSSVAAAGETQQSVSPFTQLLDKLNAGYAKLNETEKQQLTTFQNSLNGLNQADWERIVTAANVTLKSKTPGDTVEVSEAAQIIKSFTTIMYAATPTSLATAAADIQTKYNSTIKDVLGGVDAEALVNYLAAVELHLYNSGLTASDFASTEIFGIKLLNSITTVGNQPTYKPVYEAIQYSFDTNGTGGTVGLITNLLAIKDQLKGELVGEENVRAILAKAFAPAPPTGGGGGGVVTPPITDNNGGVVVDSGKISQNASEVAKAIQDAKDFKNLEITLSNSAQDVSLPPAVLKAIIEKNKQATIDVKTAAGSYSLPASQINLAELAKELGGTVDDVNIKITVKVGKDDKNVIGKNKLTAVSDVVEFKVEVDVKGKKKELKTFKTYVDRTIKGKKEFNADNSVALRLEENGEFTALPTYFAKDEAKVKSMTNSQYVVVENEKTFKDISSVWNKEQIEKLASKYIVEGRPDGSFGPYASTTRVQLAVLLTRALGLSTDAAYNNSFKDVKGNEWFVPEVTAAVNAGIIQGKVDGSFDPNAPVTRAQAAVMINRALEYVSYDKEAELNKTLKVEKFKDQSKILEWSRKDIETLLQAGIMEGLPNGNFDPYAQTSRSQMVKILDEALKTLKFIN